MELQNRIETCLNLYRLKIRVKKLQCEEDIFTLPTPLDEYALFILNLKKPTNPSVMHYLRNNGGTAPILLILEPHFYPPELKTIYYLSYNDIIFKPFFPEEIMFRIYKLCDIWNEDKFFFSKENYFDYEKACFVCKEEKIHLGKKEALLLKLLLVKSPCVVTYEEIACYIYQGESVTGESVRSMVRQLRAKIPLNFIEALKGEGYRAFRKTD